MKRVVVDASVALKWFLEDEEEVEKAHNIFSDIEKGQAEIFLPSIWIYEVINGFRSAVFKKRISNNEAKEYSKELKELNFSLNEISFLIEEIIEIALGFNLSVYDASYVAFAKYKSCPLFTGDRKLFNKLKNKISFVKWIGEY